MNASGWSQLVLFSLLLLALTKPVGLYLVRVLDVNGSGLDPRISLQNAALQAARIAKTRNLSENTVKNLISKYTEGPDLGFLGEPGVNVLRLNLALDRTGDQGPAKGK